MLNVVAMSFSPDSPSRAQPFPPRSHSLRDIPDSEWQSLDEVLASAAYPRLSRFYLCQWRPHDTADLPKMLPRLFAKGVEIEWTKDKDELMSRMEGGGQMRR